MFFIKLSLLFFLLNAFSLLRIGFLKEILWAKFCKNLSQKYNVRIVGCDYCFGFKGITVKNITVRKNRVLVEINDLKAFFSKGKSNWLKIQCKEIVLRLNTNDSVGHTTGEKHASRNIDVLRLYRHLQKLSDTITQRLLRYCIIEIGCFKAQKREADFFVIRKVIFNKNSIYGEMTNIAGKFFSIYAFRGILKPDSLNYTLKCIDLKISDTLKFAKSAGKISWIKDGQVHITNHQTGNVISHQKICSDKIRINQLKTYLHIDITEREISINSDSYCQIGNMVIYLKFIYDVNDPDFLSFTVLMDVKPESVILLLPMLKMASLSKLRSTGSIGIRIMFAFLWSDPLSYRLKLDYNVENFRIEDSGVELYYLNANFKISINSSQDKKVAYDIPANTHCDFDKAMLSKIIQFTEDPNFYEHIGCDPYFLGRSISINLSQRKFVKGASTLTMQLVKNLFLDNDKTIVRKVEEMILTLLIENYFKIPKNRILEIYLQIIPFAPNVYGITEAAQFYFEKDIIRLTLMEALVLSYIIPRPNFFLEAVTSNSEQLDRNLSAHIEHYFPIFSNQYMNEESVGLSDTISFSRDIGVFRLNKLNIATLKNAKTDYGNKYRAD